jgi:DNA-binding transcriptional regulator LsrR (DeoR family)
LLGPCSLAARMSREFFPSQKKRGIVEIKINEATKRETDIEEMLISRFGLDAAMVAKVPRSTSDYKAVGQLAIQSFLSHLKPRVKVAISWGRSIQAMVDALEPEKRPDLTLIPLMGGMTAIPSSYSGGRSNSVACRKVQRPVSGFARSHHRAVARHKDRFNA